MLPTLLAQAAAEMPTGELVAVGGGAAGALALLVRLWPLVTAAVDWLVARSQSEKLAHATTTIRAYAESSVGRLALKALEDGRIDPEEARAITEAAARELPAKVTEAAKLHFGQGFDTWLGGLVAGLLADATRKQAQAAGVAAAAKVSTAADAELVLKGGA